MKVHIESEVVIERPVAEVFDFVAVRHRENHSRWDVAVSRLEPVSSGPMGLGASFTIIRRNLGREEARTFFVTEWRPDERMTMRTAAGDFELTLRGDFKSVDGGRTRHILVGDADVRGARALLAPVMQVKFKRDIAANLSRIKELIEAEVAA